MRASSNPLAKSSDQITIPDDDADQPARVPVLKRMTSYDDDELLDLPPSRRSKDKDEMQWVLSVVGKIVAAGAVILVLLIIINALRKSFTPEPFEPVRAGAVGVSTDVVS